MGSWFSNFHIRKKEIVTDKAVADCICRVMAERQYRPAESAEDADATVVIRSSADCPWISLCSDALAHDDPDSCTAVAVPISSELHTDVLGIACFDSDYLYLNLVNPEESLDAWIGIGGDVGIQRRTVLTPWKKKVSDYPAFSASAKAQYVLTEDFLATAAPCLELPVERSMLSPGDEKETAVCLYFCLREDGERAEASQLAVLSAQANLPCFAEKISKQYFLNIGAESKGLSLYFSGSYVERDTITFSKVALKTKSSGSIPVTLQKEQLPDGQWVYSYHAPEFVIPPKVPKRLRKEKSWQLMQERWIELEFIPLGDPRKMLDVTVALEPDASPQGRAVWNVWQSFGSKKAFIEHHNKIWKRLRAYETDPNNLLPLLKEQDFD